jgi:hypothetical protein
MSLSRQLATGNRQDNSASIFDKGVIFDKTTGASKDEEEEFMGGSGNLWVPVLGEDAGLHGLAVEHERTHVT